MTVSSRSESFAQRSDDVVSDFLRGVYSWMCLGLLWSAFVAYQASQSPWMMENLTSAPVFPAVVVVMLVLAFFMRALTLELPPALAVAVFAVFTGLCGAIFAPILSQVSAAVLEQALIVTAGTFGGAAFFGRITKTNLEGIGSFCFMALWGLILAGVANLFLQSSSANFWLSAVGVLVFTGLTASDVQSLKERAHEGFTNDQERHGEALFGATLLFLDFLNLFVDFLNMLWQNSPDFLPGENDPDPFDIWPED
jgi:FtsH-binding integral membrane protein